MATALRRRAVLAIAAGGVMAFAGSAAADTPRAPACFGGPLTTLALDAKYLYFGRDSIQPPFTRPATGLYRVRREGGAAERLAHSPDGETNFIVVDGFVYWQRVHPDTRLVRRRLQKGAPVEVLAPTRRGGRQPLAVHPGACI
jgi:hypothetical protein